MRQMKKNKGGGLHLLIVKLDSVFPEQVNLPASLDLLHPALNGLGIHRLGLLSLESHLANKQIQNEHECNE